jgi:hypothetical protein
MPRAFFAYAQHERPVKVCTSECFSIVVSHRIGPVRDGNPLAPLLEKERDVGLDAATI